MHAAPPENPQNGQKTVMNVRQPGPRPSFAGRQSSGRRGLAGLSLRAIKTREATYERYLALARAEAQNGNMVAAESYYQYAEHYLRSMSPSSDKEG